MKKNAPPANGFTLVELMIVVAIIAILGAIAIPAYRQYVLRANRTSATRALQDMATREENYYFTNNAYTKVLADLGLTNPKTPEGFYTLTIPSASSTDYKVEAAPAGTQVQDTKCNDFFLARDGTQTVDGTQDPATCWQGH